MNPAHFATRSAEEVLSTLAHEMVHLWQHHFGKPPRRAYHDREWADKMDAIGLAPSDTGLVGGKRTGQHMSHYIRDGGPFFRACTELLTQGFAISWRDRGRDEEEGKTKKKSGTRTKYTCPGCGLNAWAKADAVLLCGECEVALLAEESEGEGWALVLPSPSLTRGLTASLFLAVGNIGNGLRALTLFVIHVA